MPGTILGARDRMMTRSNKVIAPLSAYILGGATDDKQGNDNRKLW